CAVLAAGQGTRFGEPKALARLESGERFLDAVVRAATESDLSPVLAVVQPGVAVPAPARAVINPHASSEQATSLRLALAGLANDRAEAVVVWPVDHPFVHVLSVLALVDAFKRTRAPIVLPVHDGHRGHPVLFARAVWLELMTTSTGGARTVVRAHAGDVVEVPVPDDGVTRDIDRRSDMPQSGGRTSDGVS
ncbi:MAG TPA: nucleotidyltransferase family protein, partial [Gemmatimonadaceae bacterium]|nr:nucleotidyltransferase family protein [Gemmatimonadaceae bacterium]